MRRWVVPALVLLGPLCAEASNNGLPLPMLGRKGNPALSKIHGMKFLHEDEPAGLSGTTRSPAEQLVIEKQREANLKSELEELEEAKKREEEVATVTTAAMLLGMVSFIMVVFYLVNWHSHSVRKHSWRLISSTSSIFISVLTFQGCFTPIHHWLEPTLGTLGVGCLAFFGCWLCVQMQLYFHRERFGNIKALSTIGSHVTAFAAIFVTYRLAQLEVFSWSPWGVLAVMGISAACLFGLSWLGWMCRLSVVLSDDDEVDSCEEVWLEHCMDFEDDAAMMCLGFLYSVFIRFLILGHMPVRQTSEDHHVDRESWREEGLMLIHCGISTVLVMVTTFFDNYCREQHFRHLITRTASLTKDFWAMSFAWCLLALGTSVVNKFPALDRYGEVMEHLLLALVLGALAVAVIFLFHACDHSLWSEHRSLRALNTAFGVLVGLSWEDTFDAAIEGLTEGSNSIVRQSLLSLGMVLLSYPAWRLYILPRSCPTLAEAQDILQHLPVCWACLPPCFERLLQLNVEDFVSVGESSSDEEENSESLKEEVAKEVLRHKIKKISAVKAQSKSWLNNE